MEYAREYEFVRAALELDERGLIDLAEKAYLHAIELLLKVGKEHPSAVSLKKVLADMIERVEVLQHKQAEPVVEAKQIPCGIDMSELALLREKHSAEAKSNAPEGVEGVDKEDVPEYYRCPITLQVFKDPVVAMDGQTYERQAIEKWFMDHKMSPMTGLTLDDTHVVPNVLVRSQVADYLENLQRRRSSGGPQTLGLKALFASEGCADDEIVSEEEVAATRDTCVT